ncbi:MAG: hypothetical protein CME36_19705 [unclassified Hahellaceae]|nr:hypothetical protein [Hahellaceae bacterium]
MTKTINWHYPRTDTTATILGLLESGSTHALTIFAKRRMGKTELLIEDIWPAAVKLGFEVRYASFWSNRSQPQKALLDAIGKKTQSIDEVKARIGLPGNYLETTASVRHPQSADDLDQLSAVFRTLLKSKKPILLMLDEIQTLASDSGEYDDFVAALRTILDVNKNRIKVIFTGSSQEGLMKMFKRQKAPLFNFSHQFELPQLGAAFVKHMTDAFQQASGRTLNPSASLRVFNRCHYVPAKFHDLLRSMLINGRVDIERAFEDHQFESGEIYQYQQVWEGLPILSQELLKMIARDGEGLYQSERLDELKSIMGVDELSTATVQNHVDRLRRASIIESLRRGQYTFAEAAFAEFVRGRASK